MTHPNLGSWALLLDPSQRIYGILRSHRVSVGLQSEKHFRTINVQWIGNEAFLAVVAVRGINNLRAVNTLDSSTPAASTTISFSINSLQRKQDFVQSRPFMAHSALCSFYRFSWWADELLIATEKHLGQATGMTADHYSCSSCIRLQRVLTTELS